MPTSQPSPLPRQAPAAVIERANQWPIMVRGATKSAKSVTFVGTNLTGKTIRGFSGIVRVFDLIGNEIVDIRVEDDSSVPAGKSAVITERIQATKNNELAQFFVTTDQKNFTYVYIPQRVVDKDGHVHYVRAISPGLR